MDPAELIVGITLFARSADQQNEQNQVLPGQNSVYLCIDR